MVNAATDTTRTPENTTSKPKKGKHIAVNKTGQPNEWIDVELTARAGKSTGKYKNYWNVKESESGQEYSVDLDRVQWTPKEGQCSNTDNGEETAGSHVTPEECLISNEAINLKKDLVSRAKSEELTSWKEQNVYSEVEDSGQDRISVRWVISDKVKEGKVVTKARLCARGFEEVQYFRKDSPTCSKECVRFVMALTASMKWSLNSIDIKTAFLQGRPFDREVYLKPPREAGTKKLWKLNKCVYGLKDASRQWYLTLKAEITKVGGKISVHEPGLFFCHSKDNTLTGVMPCHVDDLLWSGTGTFRKSVVKRLHEKFIVGTSSSVAFEYVGIEMEQDWVSKAITISQNTYAESLQYIDIGETRLENKSSRLTSEETTTLQEAIGQLNWLSCVTRPDISFDVSVLSSSIKEATVSDMVYANKVIRKVKNEKSSIKFPELDLESLQLVSFSDASYSNLRNGGSQGGHLTFLVDKNNNSCPLEWKSNRLKRVVRSALAAETLACADCMEASKHWISVINEVLKPQHKIQVVHHIDSKSLKDHLDGNKTISDRLLRVDINVIRECIELHQVEMILVEGEDNISDILTKHGVKSKGFLEIFQNGKI